MERIKPFEKITTPDERVSSFVFRDLNGCFIPPTLELVYERVSSTQLNRAVPEDVRSHFAQAQNLAIYAWFHYQFHATADFMSMVSIEFALKERLQKSSSFKHLVTLAVQSGIISDDGFRHLDPNIRRSPTYSESLIEVLPYLRNQYAHGSYTIHNDSISPLRIAADFINQLYPDSSA